MDEMLVSFDLPTNYTVDSKRTKTVVIKITSHEKYCFTVFWIAWLMELVCPQPLFLSRNCYPKEQDSFVRLCCISVRKDGWTKAAP